MRNLINKVLHVCRCTRLRWEVSRSFQAVPCLGYRPLVLAMLPKFRHRDTTIALFKFTPAVVVGSTVKKQCMFTTKKQHNKPLTEKLTGDARHETLRKGNNETLRKGNIAQKKHCGNNNTSRIFGDTLLQSRNNNIDCMIPDTVDMDATHSRQSLLAPKSV